MLFHSISFVFVFLPLLLVVYHLTPKKGKNMILILGSLFFYAWGDPKSVVVLLFIIWLNYWYGRYIERTIHKKRAIYEAVILNLVILIYFKYYGFLLDSVFSFLPKAPSYEVLAMPLGISFFTFSNLAYLFDVYRNKITAEHKFLSFTLYVSFFPKLLMGPIERYGDMRKQIAYHPMNAALMEKGFQRFLIGLTQKVVLADSLSIVWDITNTSSSVAMAWLGGIAYMLQLYFDFNGYTKMAMGLANMFGFHLHDNFHYPYMASSITAFWNRWHMTLTSWFRDYVYIPLGGNRTSFERYLRNFMIVWLLTGIWHGANWTFIVWGLYYGVVLICEKYVFVDMITRVPNWIKRCMTLFLILIGWIIFASPSLGEAVYYIGNMLGFNGNAVYDSIFIETLQNYWMYFVIGILWCTPYLHKVNRWVNKQLKQYAWIYTVCFTIVLWIFIITYMISSSYQSFLYFQF